MRIRKPIHVRSFVSSETFRRSWKIWQVGRAPEKHDEAQWEPIVRRRMRVVKTLSILTTVILVWLSKELLTGEHLDRAALIGYLFVYGLMMYFMAASFWKMLFGAWFASHGIKNNPWHPLHQQAEPSSADRVAVLFPVYHEDIHRVAAGIAACYTSLKDHFPEYLHLFDFFLLSDSRKTGYRVLEMAAIYELRHAMHSKAFYYRSRPVNSHAKLGNVTDFFRRHGKQYPFVLVMDADSLMDGQAMVSLLRMMVGNPRIGILQTNPRPILRTSFFGRMMQFAANLYGSVFTYSMQAMNMGHAIYIGHNAMIRTAPFVSHAILPKLPGKAPWGGKPLSHDIIEAVALGRAGYEVWFLPDIQGSYEEIPANMVGYLVRERRWMMGNLQHIRFFFLRGLKALHKETLIQGVMAYFSAPLWFVFLLISGYSVVHFLQHATLSISMLGQFRVPAITLLASSMVFLFVPRILSVVINLARSRAQYYGGKSKLLCSVFIETLFSFFWSPIMMIFISVFFWQWMRGTNVSWGNQDRGDTELSLIDSWKYFGKTTLFGGLLWVIIIWYTQHVNNFTNILLLTFSKGWVNSSDLLFWFFPVIGGISLSVWMARWSSMDGVWLRKKKIFVIPEEVNEPAVVRIMKEWQEKLRTRLPEPEDFSSVWHFIFTDQIFYRSHIYETRDRPQIRRRFQEVCNVDYDGNCSKMENLAWYWLTDQVTYQELLQRYNRKRGKR